MNKRTSKIGYYLSLISLFIGLWACDKDNDKYDLHSTAGPSFSDVASLGYSVILDAEPVDQGQKGTWLIFKGDNGSFENTHNPKSEFFGEPGESYVLGWKVEQGDSDETSEITVSFKALQPAMKTELADTLVGNVSAYLDAVQPMYGETGEWTIIDGEGGRLEVDNNNITSFIGKEDSKYKVRWTLSYGSKSEFLERTFRTTTLQANAGDDNLDILTNGDDLRYYNLEAYLPAGAIGKWSLYAGELGRVIKEDDPKSLFQGLVDTDYRLIWKVNLDDYESSDTVDIRYRGKWGMWTDVRDNQQYRFVEIDGKRWLADNFNYNAPITEFGRSWYYGQSSRAIVVDGHALETEEDRKRYGRLYNYYGAVEATPEGWRLPSEGEYEDLAKYLGGSFAYQEMKEDGESGLDFIHGGIAFYSNGDPNSRDTYSEQEINGYYWTSDYFEYDYSAVAFVLYSPSKQFFQIRQQAYFPGFSVRYVQDIQ